MLKEHGETSTFQPPLDLGDQTIEEEKEITRTTVPPSGRPVRIEPYPCEDPTKKVTDHREFLRPKQELSYLFNEIIQAKNNLNKSNQQLPELNGSSPLGYCDELLSHGTYQKTLDIEEGPQNRIEKLFRYLEEQPNLKLSLTNFLYWVQTENFILDSIYLPPFTIKERHLKITGGICDAIQLIPRDLLTYSSRDITERIYYAQKNRIRAPQLIEDLDQLGDIHVLEFKIGHPDSYAKINRRKHIYQIQSYIHRIHGLTGINVVGRLIYFSDMEGQRIVEDIHTINRDFWDNPKVRDI